MKLHAPLLAAAILASLASLQAQVTVVTDDFESGEFSPDWDTLAGTITAGTGAESTANFVALEPASGPLGSIFEGGSEGFVIDFFFRVQDSTDRLFNLHVSTRAGIPNVNQATINLKYDTNDGWAAFSGGWIPLTGLPALTAGEWYRARVTGTGWGTAGALFDVELSDMGGDTFTNISTDNAIYQNGDPTTAVAGSFNFNTNFGNNPGFDVDQVTVTATGPKVGTNLLTNGDFEADGFTAVGWDGAEGAAISEGIAPGSTRGASLSPASELSQSVNGQTLPDWYLDFYFNASDTPERAFNVLVNSPTGNINLRFQGTSAGAEQTWNVFDEATAGDGWGDALGLPAVQPGATYFMRIVGRGWSGGATPTYDLYLSDPNSTELVHSVVAQDRYQGVNLPSGPPTLVRFSTVNGVNPGYVIDDVQFINEDSPPLGDPEITGIECTEVDDTKSVTVHFSAVPGITYFFYASEDLNGWDELDSSTALSTDESFTETGVTSLERFYRVSDRALD